MTTGQHNITNRDYIRQITKAHEATAARLDGDGYAVTCPHGCNLGTSSHAATEAEALKRVELHRIATSAITGSPDPRPQTVIRWTNENGVEMTGRAATGEGVRELLEAVSTLGGYLRVMEDQS
jgi:hypothetical protein